MAPRQVFPYDQCGVLRTPRQLLVESQQQQQKELESHQQEQHHQREQWADLDKPSLFAPTFDESGSSGGEAGCVRQPHCSDLRDALNDDDDDESLDLGTVWASREFVPKPGVEIFVGGLTRSTRRDMLRDWFQHAGEVTEVRIARDKRRRRCRGYGYVRFATSEQANRAIDTMHRFEFKHGRFLGVLPSDENRTLFVGGLQEEWSCAYICQLLKEKMPGLRKVEPIPDREDRFKIRTFCFLEFASHAEAAVIFNRHQTSPRPPQPPPHQQAAAAASSTPQGPTTELPLPLPPPSAASAAGGGGGAGLSYERDTRTESSSSTACTSAGDNAADGSGEETGTVAGVPLVVGGATLKVDWADPLRYHIHLNGGIKGPSAPPEFGVQNGRPASRGAGCKEGSGNEGGGGAFRGAVGFDGGGGAFPAWQQQEQQQGLIRRSSPPPLVHRLCFSRNMNMALDGSSDRLTHHLSRSGSSPAATRERGYTIAAGLTSTRRSFCDDVIGSSSRGGGAGSLSQQHQFGGEGDMERPRAVSSSGVPLPRHHHASRYTPAHAGFLRDAAAAAVAAEQRDYGGRPSAPGGPVELQDQYPHRNCRPQHRSGMVGRIAGQESSMRQQLQDHDHHHGSGSGHARPYSAGAVDRGTSGGGGHYGIVRRDVRTRSASCRPYSEHQHPAATSPPSSWDCLGSGESVTARAGDGEAYLDWSGSTVPPPPSGRRELRRWSQQQQQQQRQQQRWEQQDALDRATGAFATAAWPKDAARLPQEGWVEDNDIGTRNNHNAAAGFSAWDPGFGDEQLGPRRQQSPPERFRNGVAAVSGSTAALHSHPRRHSVTEGLVGDEAIRAEVAGGGGVVGGGLARAVVGGAVPTDKDNGGSCPPGFSAGLTRGYGNDSNGRRWSETDNGVLQQAQGEEKGVEVDFGSLSMSDHSVGRAWGGVSSLMPEGGTAPADDDIVGGLWAGIGAGGLGSQERSSSWPNPFLSPGSGGCSPWGT
ncbi:unnamed protein product [Ectocarpus sp. 4 AP-2014]